MLLTASAQQETNTSFASQMNTMFSTLDKSRVPHGILLDFGMDFTNVEAINGTLRDSTYINSTRLKEVYNTLLSSRIRDVNTGFVTPQQFEQNWQNQRSSSFIALSGLYFKYSKFVNNATTTGKLTYTNGKFYDRFVSGVWQNSYQEMQTFAIAPPIKIYRGLSMQVKVPSSIFYSNFQNEVQSLQIDFSDGLGYRTVAFNQLVNVNYTTEGTKNWKYKLNLTNGNSLLSQSFIKIEATPTVLPFNQNTVAQAQSTNATTSTNSLYFQNITASNGYLGANASVRVTIDDAGNNGIRKPLIVAEGFDLGIILEPENVEGMNTYTGFRKSIEISGSAELQNLIWNNNRQYDIIYVNWNNGVDYLQRNAFALQSVIQWVNSVKIGTEKNIVLGQSMGGVIARYTLAHMEQNNVNHDTKLFVSHDAPQQGANIPVSLQYLYRHITNQFIRTSQTLFGGFVTIPILENNLGVSNYLSILDAPATRQLLSNWSNLNYGIDNSVHNTFYNELKSMGVSGSGGYPTQCRYVAMSNGAECGNFQNFNPGDLLMSYNYNKSLSFLQDLASLVVLPLGGTLGGLFIDNNLFGVGLLGLVPGNSRFTVDFQAKAISYSTNNQIYKGLISYRKKILWLIPVTVNITNVQRNQPAGILPKDTYGGGFYNTSILTNGLNVNNLYVRDKFNFIPTTSGLDIGKRNVTLNDSDYRMAYVGATPPVAPKNSPFANFSTEFNRFNPNSHNYSHLNFNSRNGEWLAKEITNVPINTDCSFVCSGGQISGADVLCNSSTYSAPTGAPFYNWSITQGNSLVTLTGNGTPNVTLTALPNASGQVILSLSMGDNGARCGNVTITKTIWVGKPIVSLPEDCWSANPTTPNCFSICKQMEMTMGNYVYVDAKGLDVVSLQNNSWEWQAITNNFSLSPNENSAYINPYWYGTPQGYLGYKVRVKNACGWSDWFENYLDVIDCSNGGKMQNFRMNNTYSVYPNPSKDIVNVDLRDQNNKPKKNATISGELFDLMGQTRAKVKIINNKATFSVQGLNKGIYVLKIYINDQVESHQIAVE